MMKLCPECGSAMQLIEEPHTEVTPTMYERFWECGFCGTCVSYSPLDWNDEDE